MMVDHNRGDPNFRPRPFRRGRYFDQVTFLKYVLVYFCFEMITFELNMFCNFFSQPFPNPNFQRQPRWLIPPEEVHLTAGNSFDQVLFLFLFIFLFFPKLEIIRQKRRQFSNKDEVAEILPFEKIKEQREQRIRERMERARRAVDLRR